MKIKELEAKNSEIQDSMKKETLAITQEIAKRGWGPNKGSLQQAGAGLQNPRSSLNQSCI